MFITSPVVLTRDSGACFSGFVVHVLWDVTTTFRCWCLPCTHIADHASMLLTMHPRCLPCCHIAYHAPTLLTMHPHCLPCSHIAFHAPTLLTMLPRLNSAPLMEAEVTLSSDKKVFRLFHWYVCMYVCTYIRVSSTCFG